MLPGTIESGTWFSSDSVQPRNHTVNTRLADAQDRVSPELHATLVFLADQKLQCHQKGASPNSGGRNGKWPFFRGGPNATCPDPVSNTFNPTFGGAGTATIEFPSDISLPNFPIAIALQGQNLNANQLGLDSVLLHSFVSSSITSSMSFGLFAGSQSISRPRNGHIVFGGYDASLLAGPFSNYSMSDTPQAGDFLRTGRCRILRSSS